MITESSNVAGGTIEGTMSGTLYYYSSTKSLMKQAETADMKHTGNKISSDEVRFK
ncbi:hypothetical protein [Fontibacter flavus]|uniref:Uncharacterized protein n=1 Tax=Fontibacter flavus TaxID=654838 RepID=A0ABV6FX84_9BACT